MDNQIFKWVAVAIFVTGFVTGANFNHIVENKYKDAFKEADNAFEPTEQTIRKIHPQYDLINEAFNIKP